MTLLDLLDLLDLLGRIGKVPPESCFSLPQLLRRGHGQRLEARRDRGHRLSLPRQDAADAVHLGHLSDAK